MPRYEKRPPAEQLNADAATIMAAIRLAMNRDCQSADELIRDVKHPHHACAILVGIVTGMIEANADLRENPPESILQKMALDLAEKGLPGV